MAASTPLRLAALALSLLAMAGTASAAGLSTQAKEMGLRLHDLPPGFKVGDDSGCGRLGTEGADPAVESWVISRQPAGCVFQYERAFAVPGPGVVPPLVESTALLTPTEAGAVEGMGLAAVLASAQTGRHTIPVEAPAPAFGQEARLFHSDDVGVQGRARGNATFLFWRQGNVLASLLVAGGAPSINDKVATRLAKRQQAHIEAPTPYTQAELDDREVELDNPRLSFPIHWLGPTFRPGHGLPRATLDAAHASNRSVGPPGEKARIEYSGLSVDIWTRRSWGRYLRSALGRQVAKWHCTRHIAVHLRKGRAVVLGGYAKDYSRCPSRRPRVWFARAFLGSTVVAVNAPICLFSVFCSAELGEFSSAAAMKAAVRALRLRPRPSF